MTHPKLQSQSDLSFSASFFWSISQIRSFELAELLLFAKRSHTYQIHHFEEKKKKEFFLNTEKLFILLMTALSVNSKKKFASFTAAKVCQPRAFSRADSDILSLALRLISSYSYMPVVTDELFSSRNTCLT